MATRVWMVLYYSEIRDASAFRAFISFFIFSFQQFGLELPPEQLLDTDDVRHTAYKGSQLKR